MNYYERLLFILYHIIFVVVTGRKRKAVTPTKGGRKNAPKSVKRAKTTRDPGEAQTCSNHDWTTHYAALLVYRTQEGNCNLTQIAIFECDIPNFGEDGSNFHYVGKLGKWLHNQRSDKKRGKLSLQREALLQKLKDEGMY